MTIRRRLIAALASAAIAAAPMLRAPAMAPLGAGLVLAGGVATDAWARAGGGRSSGGYSRPSVRTPSFSAPRSAPSYSAPRTPSTSGGYARPSSPSSVPFFGAPSSAGDQAISRQRAAEALERQRQQAVRPAPAPSAPSGSTGGGWGGRPGGGFGGGSVWSDRRTPSAVPPPPSRSGGWFAQQGWSAPPYAAAAPRSFGIWDGLFLWFMLDNLTKPGYAGWFNNHRNDPGVQQWRQQADELSRDNADLRRKLAELDSRAAPGAATPDTGWVEVPADIPPEVAAATPEARRTTSTDGGTGSGGIGFGGILFGLVLVGGAGTLAYMAVRRRRDPGASPMNPLASAAAMARNVVSPKAYTPRQFRVGMVMTADLSPFILAAGATRVTPPAASPEGRMTVAAVGQMDAAGLVRLHLDDGRGLFQLHLDAAGTPDECRYFSLFDEVTPADAAEWDAWLHPAEGMIGWPEFQTRDGKTYQRVWSPGPGRVPPQVFTEQIATASGTDTVRQQAMLYAAPTGLAAPAPQTEYILVSTVERPGQASVELRAGIDINPATLELA